MGFILKRPVSSLTTTKKPTSKEQTPVLTNEPSTLVDGDFLISNEPIKYIVATTDNAYFRWQMLVQINNFKRLGLLDDLIFVVSTNGKRTSKLKNIEKETGVKMYCYKDERVDKTYVSSIRYHILKKFINEHPKYGRCFFLLDPDVLFIEPLVLTNIMKSDNIWYLSDTRSYLNSPYVKSKGENLFNEMCEIVGITPEQVCVNDNKAGGAQHLIKNVDFSFLEKVELDSVRLYQHMINTRSKYNPSHPIQAWTADMWALLWNAWKYGHSTEIIEELNFCWATDPISCWDKNKIFHNAGVFSQDFLFNKMKFTKKLPFDEDFSYVKDGFCSKKYVEEILSVKENYPDLINKI